MKHRKLRISWSVAWGIVAVMLVGLWVRSYWICDTIWLRYYGSHFTWIVPERGLVVTEISEFTNWKGSVFAFDHLPVSARDKQLPKPNSYFVHVIRLGPKNLDVFIPIWMLMLFFVAVSVVPWSVWKRFSLRTLLIAMTLVAVELGLIVWAAR